MAKNKKQHFVPRSYLKAWCDPDAPAGHEPYVWVFERDSQVGRKRAPGNIFYETDFYTQPGPGGERDLSLEEMLHRIETKFDKVRRKSDRRLHLTVKDRFWLCAFCAAMHGRTRVQREHRRKQWGEVLESMNKLAEWAKTASPEDLKKHSEPPSRQGSQSWSQEDVQRIVDYPVQTGLPQHIQIETPILCRMSLAILCTNDDLGFITSDHPCLWFDPDHPYSGLGSKTIEVTLPLSPRRLLFLNWQGVSGYIPAPLFLVQDANRMLRFECEREYIVRRNEVRSYWFVADPIAPGGGRRP